MRSAPVGSGVRAYDLQQQKPGKRGGSFAPGHPIDAACAVRRAGQVLDFQLHQAMRGEPDHLAQQIGVRTLLQKRLGKNSLLQVPQSEKNFFLNVNYLTPVY